MRRRWHSVFTGLLATLACLLVAITVVGTWTYATVLNTDRFVGTVSAVTADPAVISSASDKFATQVVVALQIQSRLEALLPDRLDGLAAKFADAVRDRIATAVQSGLSSERFQTFWVDALHEMHSRLLALLRGDAPNAELSNGVLTLDLLGAISDALHQLQADGVIDQSIQLPDWSGEASRGATIDILNRQLTLTLPPDFGYVEVTNVAWLEQLSGLVRAADTLVIVLVVLSAALVAAAIWAIDRRKRAVALMTLTIEALLLITGIIAAYVGGPLAADIAAQNSLALILGFASELAGSLMGWLAVAALGVAVIGIALLFVVKNRKCSPVDRRTSMISRLISFYRLQIEILWKWRPGRRALMRRGIVRWSWARWRCC